LLEIYEVYETIFLIFFQFSHILSKFLDCESAIVFPILAPSMTVGPVHIHAISSYAPHVIPRKCLVLWTNQARGNLPQILNFNATSQESLRIYNNKENVLGFNRSLDVEPAELSEITVDREVLRFLLGLLLLGLSPEEKRPQKCKN